MKRKITFKLRQGYDSLPLEIQSDAIEESSEHYKVLTLLWGGERHRIAELVAGVSRLGGHSTYERTHRPLTTTRKMYQIIRDLRDMGCPIVGDSKGVYIATDVRQVRQFAEHLEQKAKSDIRSMLSLRKTMLSMVRAYSPSLFDDLDDEELSTNPLPDGKTTQTHRGAGEPVRQ